jgi:uncharacterized integral membrane protein
MQAIVVIILILAILLVIFTLQNAMDITINVFFWEIKDAPLVLVLLTCLLLGYLIASFYFSPKLWKLKREYKQLIKFNSELKELHDLNHKTHRKPTDDNTDPEGIELDEDNNDDSTFFKD